MEMEFVYAGVSDTCRRYVAAEVSRDALFSRRKVRIGKVRVERCSTLRHELVEDYYLSGETFSTRCGDENFLTRFVLFFFSPLRGSINIPRYSVVD